MDLTIANLEQAILDLITQDATMSAYVRTVESYAGHFEEDLGKMPRLFPAVFVLFRDSRTTALSNVEVVADYTYSILVAAQTLRGNVQARFGTPESIGVYQMLTDLRTLLLGNPLAAFENTVAHLLPVSETAVLNTRAMSIYDAQYATRGNILRSIYLG